MADNFAQAFFAGQDDRRNQQLRQQEQQRRNQLADLSISKEERAQQVDQRQALYSLAKGYKNYVAQNPDGGQQYYDRFLAPSLRGLGFGDVGPYDATAVGQVADQVLAAYAGAASGSELAPRVVGNALVDSTGRVLYQAPQEQDYQWSERVGAWIPKPMAQANQTEGVSAGGQPYRLDPNLTPEQREAAMADIASNGGANSYQLPPRTQAGSQPLAAIPVAGIGPKVDTPDETFSQPQSVTFPDGTVRLVQFGNRGTRREVEGVAPPPTDRDAKPPTEGERKAATLLQRLTSSQQQLEQAVKEDKSAQSPNLASDVVRSLPLIGGPAANAVTPEARQRVEAAQLDILDAALTLGTGAAYTREQLEGYRRSFFPQIGDSQGTIDDKAARLQNVIQAARIAAGRASPDNQERQQQGQPVRIQSAEDYNRLPSGTLFIAPDGTQRRKR